MIPADVVAKALAQIAKRSANHDYFFQRLSSPDWIAPLADAGLFKDPPNAQRDGDTISYALWPESRYLARMAGLAPEQVLRAIEGVPDTDNFRVHEDFIAAALQMPVHLAASWSRREVKWIRQQEQLLFLLPEKLCELCVFLAKGGELAEALHLARALLALTPDPAGHSERAKFSDWMYDKILREEFPALAQAAGLDALDLLCELLSGALAQDAEKTYREDLSWIWRPAIDDHVQNAGEGEPRHSLVAAVRESALQLLESRSVPAADVFEHLGRGTAFVFRRIAAYVLALDVSRAPELATAWLLSADLATVPGLHREHAALLRASLRSLAPDDLNRAMELYLQTPQTDAEEGSRARWRLRRLAALAGSAPDPWSTEHQALRQELGGDPDHPDFLSHTSSHVGPTSPRSQNQLSDMPVDEVATFLRSWRPPGTFDGPSVEGLGLQLQGDVARRCTEYVSHLDLFRDVEPTYASAIVRGLADGLRAKQAFDWASVTDYSRWIVERRRSASDASSLDDDGETHWGWSRRAVVRLLGEGADRNSFTPVLFERVRDVVIAVCADPDPTPADDANTSMDPSTHALNSTRGVAMHTLIRLAGYAKRTLDATSLDPEIAGTLESHLDPEVDPSLAIRSVFGQWLGWLAAIDPPWLEAHLSQIFPTEHHRAAFRHAAWKAYVNYNQPYDDVLQLLREEYSAAVDRLDPHEGKKGRDHVERLGQHLMIFVGRGKLAWDDSDRLVQRYFEGVESKTAEHALSFVGRYLYSTKEDIPPEWISRYQNLWDKVLQSVQSNQRLKPVVLSSFGWWYASGRFDGSWSLDRLKSATTLAGELEADDLVLESLADLASHEAEAALRLTRLVLACDRGWTFRTAQEHVETILRAALSVPRVREDAVQLIHELGARGHTDLRDLLASEM